MGGFLVKRRDTITAVIISESGLAALARAVRLAMTTVPMSHPQPRVQSVGSTRRTIPLTDIGASYPAGAEFADVRRFTFEYRGSSY
jgi:hypothetical protein